MAKKIQHKRGLEANLPILDVAEIALTTDTGRPFIGSPNGNIEISKKVDMDAATIQTETKLQNKIDEYGVSISKYASDSTGIVDSSTALTSALSSSEDEIFIPKGVYLISKNITIPADKKLNFGRNARLKPGNGITITINGTWDASDDDWIFDLSLGGIINGNFKVYEIHPEWFGAKGDGVTDDAKAFNDAMSVCETKRIIKLGAKEYRVRSTIENKGRGIKGIQTYVDSASGGSLITWDPIDKSTDLLPCLRIEFSGTGAVFESFKIMGTVGYNTRHLATWIDKVKLEAGTYDMFSVGCAGIEVAGGATPVFRDVRTQRVKVGIVYNSSDGHITTYDCIWSGLIGVYCRKNSEDYFFQGGQITGAFCGIMIGIINTSNHRGGMALTMLRVHMGFSPYAIYQTKDTDDYDSLSNCLGIYGSFESVRFECIGEAAIKLLPKSDSSGYFSGVGMSWTPDTFDGYDEHDGGWVCPIPDDLMDQVDKQKYAFIFGRVSRKLVMDNIDGGGAIPGKIGTAYIDFLVADSVMLDALGDPSLITIREKHHPVSIVLTTPQAVEDSIHTKLNSPISHGQLLKNPEVLTNWKVERATLSLLTDLSLLPAPLSREAKYFLGENIKIIKVTPDGSSDTPYISMPFDKLTADTSRDICYEYFILAESPSPVRSRFDFLGWSYLYDRTEYLPALVWFRVRSRGLKSPIEDFLNLSLFGFATPIYIAGLMASYDNNASYSPEPHPYTNSDFEIADKKGLILTDNSTGIRYKINIVNGVIAVTAI